MPTRRRLPPRNTLYKGNRMRGECILMEGFHQANLQKIIRIDIGGTLVKVLFGPEFCDRYDVHRECLKFTIAHGAAPHLTCSCPKDRLPSAASAARTLKRNAAQDSNSLDMDRIRRSRHEPDPFA